MPAAVMLTAMESGGAASDTVITVTSDQGVGPLFSYIMYLGQEPSEMVRRRGPTPTPTPTFSTRSPIVS